MKPTIGIRLVLATLAAAALGATSDTSASAAKIQQVRYKTREIDSVKLFYREADSTSHATIVLLHGFPSSSHMYRD